MIWENITYGVSSHRYYRNLTRVLAQGHLTSQFMADTAISGASPLTSDFYASTSDMRYSVGSNGSSGNGTGVVMSRFMDDGNQRGSTGTMDEAGRGRVSNHHKMLGNIGLMRAMKNRPNGSGNSNANPSSGK